MKKTHRKILIFIFVFVLINISFLFNTSAKYKNSLENNDEVDQEQTQINSVTLVYNQNQIAQSFSPNLPKITRIKLYLSKKGEISSDFNLIIREKLTGQKIREISVSNEDIPNKQPEWIEFNFEDIDTENDRYYFFCKTNSGDKNNYYEVYGHTLDLYENGVSYTTNNSGTTWLQDTDLDFTFKTYGAGPVLSIQYVRGLSGGRIGLGIKNTGTSSANNIKITANFNGGLILKRSYEEEPNATLEPNNELHTEIFPIIGLGISNLDLFVTSDETDTIETNRELFMFFFYIYIKPVG